MPPKERYPAKAHSVVMAYSAQYRVVVILGGAAGFESPNGQVRLLIVLGSAPDLGSGGHQFESGRFHQLPGRSRMMCARPSSHTENENAR